MQQTSSFLNRTVDDVDEVPVVFVVSLSSFVLEAFNVGEGDGGGGSDAVALAAVAATGGATVLDGSPKTITSPFSTAFSYRSSIDLLPTTAKSRCSCSSTAAVVAVVAVVVSGVAVVGDAAVDAIAVVDAPSLRRAAASPILFLAAFRFARRGSLTIECVLIVGVNGRALSLSLSILNRL
jgi:hypothetical protein